MFVTQIDLAMIRMRTNVKRNEKNWSELKALIKDAKEFRETVYGIESEADAVKKEGLKAKAKENNKNKNKRGKGGKGGKGGKAKGGKGKKVKEEAELTEEQREKAALQSKEFWDIVERVEHLEKDVKDGKMHEAWAKDLVQGIKDDEF